MPQAFEKNQKQAEGAGDLDKDNLCTREKALNVF
jgi:hypothetical protein